MKSSALCWGHRNGRPDWKDTRLVCRHQHLLSPRYSAPPSGWQAKLPPPQLTRSLALLHCCCFLGGCASNCHRHWNQRLSIAFQTARMFLFTRRIRQWTWFTLRMFTLKNWQMFWKHLIQIKQTEKDFVCALCCNIAFFPVSLSSTSILFLLSVSFFVLTSYFYL